MTDGPMVRLAKAAQAIGDDHMTHDHSKLSREDDDRAHEAMLAVADLVGPCGTCGGTGIVEPFEICSTCDGIGTDPLARAREADAALEGLERGDLEMRL